MLNRFTRGVAAVAGTLLAFGAAGTIAAGAANAVTYVQVPAGWQAGGHNYEFRYATTTFYIPESACATTHGNWVGGGIELVGSVSDTNATVGGGCIGTQPVVGWTTESLGHTSGNVLFVSADDNITVSVYYDVSTGYDYFYATDNTTNTSADWAHKAGAAEYKDVLVGCIVNDPLPNPPSPGTNYILSAFTATGVTSLDGTHGTGLDGPWGVTQVNAYNGGHLIASAPILFNGDSSLNVRVYGNG